MNEYHGPMLELFNLCVEEFGLWIFHVVRAVVSCAF